MISHSFLKQIISQSNYLVLIFQIDDISYKLSVDHKVVDIDTYLPFKSTEEIVSFCSNEDGLLPEKKEALRKRIHAKTNKESVMTFASSLTNAFFENSPLLGTHRWPYKR